MAAGQPNYPNARQYAAIKARDALESLEPMKLATVLDGQLTLKFALPSHAGLFNSLEKRCHGEESSTKPSPNIGEIASQSLAMTRPFHEN